MTKLSPARLLEQLRSRELHIPLTLIGEPDRPESVPFHQLFTGDTLQNRIQRVAERMNSYKLTAAASLFQKKYASSLLASVLQPMTFAGAGFLANGDDMEIVLINDLPAGILLKGEALPLLLPERLPFQGSEPDGWQIVDSAEHLRREVFRAAFDNNLGPLIYRIAAEFDLSPRIMWGNVGNYCGFLYGEKLESPLAGCQGFGEDRSALLNSVGFDAPKLHHTFREVWLAEAEPAQWIRVRSSCCLWYQFPGNKRCYTCPNLCDNERAELLAS
jgi:ferric iron reductase protein FhuF